MKARTLASAASRGPAPRGDVRRPALFGMTTVALRLVVLRCADLARAASFYRALGFDLVEEQHGAGPRHFSCTLGDVILELYPQGEGAASAGLRLGLRVSDVAAVVASIRAAGVGAVLRAVDDPPGALVRDPDGHRLELEQAAAR